MLIEQSQSGIHRKATARNGNHVAGHGGITGLQERVYLSEIRKGRVRLQGESPAGVGQKAEMRTARLVSVLDFADMTNTETNRSQSDMARDRSGGKEVEVREANKLRVNPNLPTSRRT